MRTITKPPRPSAKPRRPNAERPWNWPTQVNRDLWFDTSLSTLLDNAKMTTDPSGRLLVTSDNYSNGPFDFGDGPVALDGFVLRYELDGSHGDYFTYDATTGSIDGTYSQSISVLPNGGFRLVHPSNATAIDFGGGVIGWTGSFVVDLDENLAHVSSFGIGSSYFPQLVDHAVAPNGSMVLGGTFFGQNIDVAGMTFSADVAQAMLVGHWPATSVRPTNPEILAVFGLFAVDHPLL